MADKVIFDKGDFGSRLASNTQLMSMVVTEFLKEVEGLVPELGALIRNEDWAAAGRVAHRIKGASAEVSAYAMSEDARQIEFAVKANTVSTIPEYFAELEVHYQLLKVALAEHFS